jgi:hypothetical protein
MGARAAKNMLQLRQTRISLRQPGVRTGNSGLHESTPGYGPMPAQQGGIHESFDRWFVACVDACPSPKFCPPLISRGYAVAIHRQSAIALSHDRHGCTLDWCDRPILPGPSPTASRKPRPSPTTRGIEAKASQAKACSVRQAILGVGTKVLVRVETGTYRGHPRNGGPMASGRLQIVLEADFQGTKTYWAKGNSKASAGINLSDGRGKSDVGRAAHSRGASHVGIRCFRAKHLPLDETSAERSGASQPVARIFVESSRSHSGDGLLYRSNPQLRHALLLLRDQPRSSSDSPLQRHQTPDELLDCPAVAGSVSV